MKKLLIKIRHAFLKPVLQRIDELYFSMHSLSNSCATGFDSEKKYLYLTILNYHREKYGIHMNINDQPLVSSICRPTDIIHYRNWSELFYQGNLLMHRKAWEYTFIAQALYERGLLKEGKCGLGFAVGQEPLPALFASYACRILATDIDPCEFNDSANWNIFLQHADGLENLHFPDICSKETLEQNVHFAYLNMNHIPDSVREYDFCWSACALEHLGSIEHGKQFVYNMLKCLKPGGIAVHTTEFNLSSDACTVMAGSSVIFRKSDLVDIVETLTSQGHYVEPLDFRLDNSAADQVISLLPFRKPGSEQDIRPHFKIELDGYLTTSFGLIIRKKI